MEVSWYPRTKSKSILNFLNDSVNLYCRTRLYEESDEFNRMVAQDACIKKGTENFWTFCDQRLTLPEDKHDDLYTYYCIMTAMISIRKLRQLNKMDEERKAGFRPPTFSGQ